MKAMTLNQVSLFSQNENPLEFTDLPDPKPEPGEILIKVSACGVCHTELDEIEGRTPPKFPMILGHQVVGVVEQNGEGAERFQPGERVGVHTPL